jgi:hypothetical protein
MERKFVSKLNQLKPAALARKEAVQQLKETIQSVLLLLLFFKLIKTSILCLFKC